MIEEATLNAFYKLNHRLGERVFSKNNYAEDLSQYLKKIDIISYKLYYYEDRIYSYKREKIDGKYRYVIRRYGEIHETEPVNRVSKDKLNTYTDKLV